MFPFPLFLLCGAVALFTPLPYTNLFCFFVLLSVFLWIAATSTTCNPSHNHRRARSLPTWERINEEEEETKFFLHLRSLSTLCVIACRQIAAFRRRWSPMSIRGAVISSFRLWGDTQNQTRTERWTHTNNNNTENTENKHTYHLHRHPPPQISIQSPLQSPLPSPSPSPPLVSFFVGASLQPSIFSNVAKTLNIRFGLFGESADAVDPDDNRLFFPPPFADLIDSVSSATDTHTH